RRPGPSAARADRCRPFAASADRLSGPSSGKPDSRPGRRKTMIRLRDLAPGLLACGALIACGSSPPTRYYALSGISPDTGGASGAAAGAIPLRVEPVAIPAELDRPELVNHIGPNQVRIADQDHWAAP